MQTYNTLNDAIALAKFAHFKQTDKAGMPYIDHPLRVMEACKGQGAMPYVLQAAVLHDVTEDTAFTHQILLDLGFSEAVVELLYLLDRRYSALVHNQQKVLQGLRPDRFVDVYLPDDADHYYYFHIKNNPDATLIKRADIADNTQRWRLNYLAPDTQTRLVAKYDKALERLS